MGKIEILKTNQIISSKIFEIIHTSKEYCYIITPYMELCNLLDKELMNASKLNKNLIFLLNEINSGSTNLTNYLNGQLNFEVHLIRNLNARIYLNESVALVGSLSLYDYSKNPTLESIFLLKGNDIIEEIREHIIKSALLIHNHKIYNKMTYVTANKANEKVTSHKYNNEKYWKGYCVICGSKIHMNKFSDLKLENMLCNDCSKNHRFKTEEKHLTSFCHFCGEVFNSNSRKPLHFQCFLKIREKPKIVV